MKTRILRYVTVLALGALGCDAGPPSGSGDERAEPLESQTASVPRPGPDAVSVRLTVRLDRTGHMEVVDAVELPGIIKLERAANRRWVYEAQDRSGLVAVAAVDVDFEQRPIKDGQHGEVQPI